MNESHLHYSMLIEWSEEDQAYLVTLPEWADRVIMPATHGSTYGEAKDQKRARVIEQAFALQNSEQPMRRPR